MVTGSALTSFVPKGQPLISPGCCEKAIIPAVVAKHDSPIDLPERGPVGRPARNECRETGPQRMAVVDYVICISLAQGSYLFAMFAALTSLEASERPFE